MTCTVFYNGSRLPKSQRDSSSKNRLASFISSSESLGMSTNTALRSATLAAHCAMSSAGPGRGVSEALTEDSGPAGTDDSQSANDRGDPLAPPGVGGHMGLAGPAERGASDTACNAGGRWAATCWTAAAGTRGERPARGKWGAAPVARNGDGGACRDCDGTDAVLAEAGEDAEGKDCSDASTPAAVTLMSSDSAAMLFDDGEPLW